jgi:hypothetical protein
MKLEPVHHYDNHTGVFIQSFPSFTEAEAQLKLYRGAVKDYLISKSPNPKMLFSREKYDVHPLKAGTTEAIIPTQTIMLTEADIRRKHDKVFAIRTFIAEIPAGKFIEEGAMLRSLGMFGKPGYRDALKQPELTEHRGRADGVVYYGSIQSIRTMKTEGVLQ